MYHLLYVREKHVAKISWYFLHYEALNMWLANIMQTTVCFKMRAVLYNCIHIIVSDCYCIGKDKAII